MAYDLIFIYSKVIWNCENMNFFYNSNVQKLNNRLSFLYRKELPVFQEGSMSPS